MRRCVFSRQSGESNPNVKWIVCGDCQEVLREGRWAELLCRALHEAYRIRERLGRTR